MNCPMCTRHQDEPEFLITQFEHSRLFLNRDQFFPGYCFLITREHVTELFHLRKEIRHELIDEVNRVASALNDCFKPAKMNYECLGNMVPHMHWHLVPRFTTDPLWPRPIWSEPHDEKHLDAGAYAKVIDQIRAKL